MLWTKTGKPPVKRFDKFRRVFCHSDDSGVVRAAVVGMTKNKMESSITGFHKPSYMVTTILFSAIQSGKAAVERVVATGDESGFVGAEV